MDKTTKATERPELPDESLDEVSGGIQAGLVYQEGSGEFTDTSSEDPAPRKPQWF